MALVTYESVAGAAEAIRQAGGTPSVRGVKSHLGGGSPNAIAPLLKEWWAGRPLVRASDIELDPRISQLIVEQVQKAASVAARAAEERAATVQEDADAVAEAGREAEAEAGRLTIALETAQAETARIAAELERMREQSERDNKAGAEREAILSAKAQEERARGDLLASQLSKAEVRLEEVPRLHQEVERLRASLAEAQAGRQKAEQLAAVHAAQFESADRRAADLEAREKAAIARAMEAEKAAQQAQQAEKNAQIAEHEAQARLEALKEVVAELRSRPETAKPKDNK